MKFYVLGIANAALALLAAFDILLTSTQQAAIIAFVNVIALAADAGWQTYQKRQAPEAAKA